MHTKEIITYDKAKKFTTRIFVCNMCFHVMSALHLKIAVLKF